MSELEIYKGMVKKMKDDEIKEKKTKRIIEKIEGLATYVTIPRELAIYNVNIDSQEAKLLIDYITNLQKENEQLRTQVNTYENPDDLTLFYMWLDEKAKDKMKQQENEIIQLKQFNQMITEMGENHKSRIEKAVEYINSGIGKSLKEEYCCFGILLNILNGRSDE